MILSPINLRSGQRSNVNTIFLGWHSPYTSQPKSIEQDTAKFEAEFLAEFADLLPNTVQSESAGKPIFNGFKVAASKKKVKVAEPVQKPEKEVAQIEKTDKGFSSCTLFEPLKTKAQALRILSEQGFTHYTFNGKVAIIPKKYRS